MRSLSFFVILILACSSLFAQIEVTHGPVIGAITENSARVYLRVSDSAWVEVQVDSNEQFHSPRVGRKVSQFDRDFQVVIDLNGLTPDTKYFITILVDNVLSERIGSFYTAPDTSQKANFTFVTGSCQETPNMKVFGVIPQYNPRFMVHTGDFTYPSYQLSNDYPANPERVTEAWRKRFEEVRMDTMLWNVPIAYMPDDDDSFGSSKYVTQGAGLTHDSITGDPINFFISDSISETERQNCFEGYTTYFPGYPIIDSTEGYYHSFRYANTEFFMLDARSAADANSEAYRFDSTTGLWSFEPTTDHSILGEKQMSWFLQALEQSTADWKFIVTGLPFNPSIRRLIDLGIVMQNFETTIAGESGTGFRLAVSFSGYWAGFPADIEKVLTHIDSLNITGVSIISGDTHHNVMDDGTNSAIPELNASGLSVATTELAFQLAEFAPVIGQPRIEDSLWNAGGNGLHNEVLTNAFGKVEVFGEDSVQYCIVDENDLTLSCFTLFKDGSVRNPLNPGLAASHNYHYNTAIIRGVYPNPNEGTFYLELANGLVKSDIQNFGVMDVSGKLFKDVKVRWLSDSRAEISIGEKAEGNYFLALSTADSQSVVKLVINN